MPTTGSPLPTSEQWYLLQKFGTDPYVDDGTHPNINTTKYPGSTSLSKEQFFAKLKELGIKYNASSTGMYADNKDHHSYWAGYNAVGTLTWDIPSTFSEIEVCYSGYSLQQYNGYVEVIFKNNTTGKEEKKTTIPHGKITGATRPFRKDKFKLEANNKYTLTMSEHGTHVLLLKYILVKLKNK